MTPQFIEKLVRKAEACSTMGEIEFESEGEKLVLRFGHSSPASRASHDGTCAVTATNDHSSSVAMGATRRILRAPATGVLRSTHPFLEHPTALLGAEIAEGQQLAFLQVGCVLCSVEADSHGVIGPMLAIEGSTVGFGQALFELL